MKATTRRDFMRTTTGAGIAGLLLPSWLFPRATRTVEIDFSLFCCDYTKPRYDMTRPFLQSGSVYATDGLQGIRVGKNVLADLAGEEARLPPAERLPWADPDSAGWVSPSKLERVASKWEVCPTCDCKGRVGNGVVPCKGCYHLEDMTDEEIDRWSRGEWPACECGGREWVGGSECPECKGKGGVDYAWAIGGQVIAPVFIRRHMTLPGVEFRCGEPFPAVCNGGPRFPGGVHTRFDGGVGMICGLDKTVH